MARATNMTKQALERLKLEREKLLDQQVALGNQIKGLDRAIALIEGGGALEAECPPPAPPPTRRARMPIKDLVLGILTETQAGGLSAAQVVETAAKQGVSLDRASVSSLLSRLKREGVLTLDGNAYKPSAPGGGSVVVNHPKHAA